MQARTAIGNSKRAAITRLFSSAVFHQLAKKGRSPIFARLIKEIGRERFSESNLVSDAFDKALSTIAVPGDRDEYVYKSAIIEKILLGRHSLRSATMLTEVRVDGNKADVVVLNGTSTVYEIKSERDSLVRLPDQLESYRRAFAAVNVITSTSHCDRVMDIASDDIGVLVLNSRGQISTIRRAIVRPDRINPETLFGALRIHEATRVLLDLGVEVPDVPNTERFGVVRSYFVDQCPVALHAAAIKVLRKSRCQENLEGFLSKLPKSLKAAALSTPIRKGDQARLMTAVETPLNETEQWA